MKKLIMTIVIAACLALCAAVWLQSEVGEKTPTPAPTPAVIATEPPIAERKTKVEAAPQTEKEKTEISKQEPCHEVISEPEIAPAEPAAAPKPVLEPMPEPIPAPEITPAPESTPEPTPTVIDSQSGDMVYVPGFGWLESQGPNHVEYSEDMYENDNKIGIMG